MESSIVNRVYGVSQISLSKVQRTSEKEPFITKSHGQTFEIELYVEIVIIIKYNDPLRTKKSF